MAITHLIWIYILTIIFFRFSFFVTDFIVMDIENFLFQINIYLHCRTYIFTLISGVHLLRSTFNTFFSGKLQKNFFFKHLKGRISGYLRTEMPFDRSIGLFLIPRCCIKFGLHYHVGSVRSTTYWSFFEAGGKEGRRQKKPGQNQLKRCQVFRRFVCCRVT